MGSNLHSYVILVGIDFSEPSDQALDHALELANHRGDAEVHVLYVDDRFRPEGEGEGTDSALLRVEKRAIARMEEVGKRIGGKPKLRRLVSHFRIGSAAEQIVQLAADINADLVIMGTHGWSGIRRLVLGSIAERVLRLSRCPVWVVRPKDHEGLGKVPEIEPPCPQCVAKQRETNGAQLWCARHSEPRVRPHTYSYVDNSFISRDTECYEPTPLRGV